MERLVFQFSLIAVMTIYLYNGYKLLQIRTTIKTFIVFAIITSLATGLIFAVSPAFATKSSGSNGLEIADDKVHENTGGLSETRL